MIPLLLLIMLSWDSQSLPRKKKLREDRSIVPQLLPNYTTSPLPPADQVGCNAAWLSCRYRDGCGSALKQYMTACDNLVSGKLWNYSSNIYFLFTISGNSTECDINCRLSLIALISTREGERLMQVIIYIFDLDKYYLRKWSLIWLIRNLVDS